MSSRRLTRFFIRTIIVAGIAVTAVIACSPYGPQPGFAYPLIERRVRIVAPPDSVYAYLGNSANAHTWSVYVDHITPTNAEMVKDGAVGSTRRCFQQADEQGVWWDETILEAKPAVRRQIAMNTLHGFPLTAPHLATEQRYTRLKDGGTELIFTLFFKDYSPTLSERLKMYIGAYKVQNVYERNLENVKREVEQKMTGIIKGA